MKLSHRQVQTLDRIRENAGRRLDLNKSEIRHLEDLGLIRTATEWCGAGYAWTSATLTLQGVRELLSNQVRLGLREVRERGPVRRL